MGAADRTVQHLRLRAPSAQAAMRATHRLEDALRCASLPDAGERVLLVRRLHLGRLPEGLSSQSLSLLIEQRVAALGGAWVHGGEERATFSDTVFFEGRWQAASIALDRRARGLPLAAWYWRAALPDVSLQADPQAFVPGLWRCLEREAAASASQSALVADAVARGHGDWLVRYLSHTLGPTRGASLTQETTADSFDGGEADVGVVHYRDPHGVDVPRAWPAALHAHLRAAGWRAHRTRATLPPSVGRSGSPGVSMPPMDLTEERPRAAAAAPGAVTTGATADMSTREDADAPRATSVGGLLFLLPVLSGLGFVEWQAQHADPPLCAPILRLALRHLRVAKTDPAWALVDSLPAAAGPWSRSHGEMAAAWLDACRRELYRADKLSLARLCRRPARLRWSATHLDVQLDLRHADIRVRRQGFDLDPGWLPWLGRVVTFSYQRLDPLP
ncbi:hypothetical protein ASE11_05545 [Hydrogenophaga sp. Root209]|uniref:hypothetical protein n=1 Tax=Hydrogenophaga sp. Root209 TaxID=1736490 RepID=UPI0006FC66B6|nr:hypothetical protein [Hydrogenophaga sp. Root209]KRC01096.1 hypothetical protein ASE11_05545 [Hydrogenophaga sp. Root209]